MEHWNIAFRKYRVKWQWIWLFCLILWRPGSCAMTKMGGTQNCRLHVQCICRSIKKAKRDKTPAHKAKRMPQNQESEDGGRQVLNTTVRLSAPSCPDELLLPLTWKTGQWDKHTHTASCSKPEGRQTFGWWGRPWNCPHEAPISLPAAHCVLNNPALLRGKPLLEKNSQREISLLLNLQENARKISGKFTSFLSGCFLISRTEETTGGGGRGGTSAQTWTPATPLPKMKWQCKKHTNLQFLPETDQNAVG